LDWLGLGSRTFRKILRMENEQKVCKVQTVEGVGATDKEFPLTCGFALPPLFPIVKQHNVIGRFNSVKNEKI
jgi:hypothetical protein